MGELWAEIIWVFLVFLAGIATGSFINVLAGRLPLEKSVLWPNSRCLTCLSPLYLIDNLPIVGWLARRGKCRFCGTSFSSRYMWVELTTGIAFAVIYYFEVLHNWHRVPFFAETQHMASQGLTSWQGWVYWLHHVLLFSLLFTASLCDWDHRSIPLSLTMVGTVIGLVGAVLLPWPFPSHPLVAQSLPAVGNPMGSSWAFNVAPGKVPSGLYQWPVWGPVPAWLESHRWALGLLTGLGGAIAGMALIRMVKFLFEKGLGKEALGLGDADLMMMAGAFVGWQIVVTSFFIGVLLTLPFGLLMAVRRGQGSLPFGPGLSAGVIVTIALWPRLAPALQPIFFEEMLILVAAVVLFGGTFLASGLLRLMGRGGQPATN